MALKSEFLKTYVTPEEKSEFCRLAEADRRTDTNVLRIFVEAYISSGGKVIYQLLENTLNK